MKKTSNEKSCHSFYLQFKCTVFSKLTNICSFYYAVAKLPHNIHTCNILYRKIIFVLYIYQQRENMTKGQSQIHFVSEINLRCQTNHFTYTKKHTTIATFYFGVQQSTNTHITG